MKYYVISLVPPSKTNPITASLFRDAIYTLIYAPVIVLITIIRKSVTFSFFPLDKAHDAVSTTTLLHSPIASLVKIYI